MAQQRQADKDMTQVGQEATRQMAGQAGHAARTMSDAAERTARAGADMMQRNSDQVRQAFEAGSETAARVAERAFSQFARAFGVVTGDGAQQAAQQSARNMEAIMQSGSVLADGLQTISRELMTFAQHRAEQNMDRFEALSGCRSVQDFVAAQTDLVRDHLEDFLQTTKRIAEVSTRMVNEATHMTDTTLAPR
jgi:hypothetical protein